MTHAERLSEGSYRRLFEGAPWPCLVLRPDLTIAVVSDAYLYATDTEREAIVDRPLLEVFAGAADDGSGETLRNLRSSLERVLSSRQPDSITIERQRKHLGAWNLVSTPVLDPSGAIAYILHRIDDTTDLVHLKRAGREHSRMTRRLGLRLQALERELEEHKLANERLRAGGSGPQDDVMRQLATTVAHDFNDLMTVIAGSLSVIDDLTRAPGDLRQLTAAMRRAIERGSRLTGQLLSVGRGLAGLPDPFALSDLLRDFAVNAAFSLDHRMADGGMVGALAAAHLGEPQPATNAALPTGIGRCGRVLVVEDDPDVLCAVLGAVARLGYGTVAARDGQEALAALGGTEPLDLLFTDIVMPRGMNGIQLARRAREIRPNLAVLLTSGYGFHALSEAADDGFPILQKPYPHDALAERLRHLIGA